MSRSPNVFNIPPHRAFADALVAGVLDQHGADRLKMGFGLILLPNNRAVQAVRDAFVRQAEDGLLLPRLAPIGDDDIDARLGAALDPMGDDAIPPAIDPLHRQLILARLIQVERELAVAPRQSLDAAEAMRLAADLAHTLDQLIVEGIDPRSLAELAGVHELSLHWQTSLRLLGVILEQWPSALAAHQAVDLTQRRNLVLDRLMRRWSDAPPRGFVIAAGISSASPHVAALLGLVARLPHGCVVLAGLDPHMSDDDWDSVAGDAKRRAIETHPQFHLRMLLDRMKVARGEVKLWRRASASDAPAQRSRALSHAMALPSATAHWHALATPEIRMKGVTACACTTPAHEALTIALALRHALETPQQTAALVTPDRDLARRVVALLARWGIHADDSAGLPLSATRTGGLILALVDLLASDFAPVPLLTVLKHPMVRSNDPDLTWLDGVRAMDLALRGPRPAPSLDGISAFLASGSDHERRVRDRAAAWWHRVAPQFAPLGAVRQAPIKLGGVLAVLRETVVRLAGDEAWAGSAGRAAADIFTRLEAFAADGPHTISVPSLPRLFRQVMDAVSVRQNAALHPRIAIWGLLEAKLQTADVMILGGLNEGVWPALPSSDPWLAPKIRQLLGLPTLERRIGLAAHDLIGAMGAKQVLLTRARRDATSATIASRFWLRIAALTGGLPSPNPDYVVLAEQLDLPHSLPQPAKRPRPRVPAAYRPRVVRITDLDTLKADPYSFYARSILHLSPLEVVDADPSPSWRGSLIHAALESWGKQEDFDTDALGGCFAAAFADENLHPLLTTLWMPRFAQAAEWIARRTSDARADGRAPIALEISGELELYGVTLRGRLDRVDRCPDGGLVVIDYKTGSPPKPKQIASGHALQLGLIAIMLAHNAFPGVSGVSQGFEYWSLGREPNGGYGYAASALSKGQTADDFIATTEAHFREAVETWLTGDAPFVAKRVPDYAYAEYDALMRYDEWYGRNG